jgi:hypothetical protein
MSSLHEMMKAINAYHMEAHPELPTPEEIANLERQRDRLIAKLNAQGKQVILVKAAHLESCGRYVCEGDDGFNGYDPLPGTIIVERRIIHE